MTSWLVKSKQIIGAHSQTLFPQFSYFWCSSIFRQIWLY